MARLFELYANVREARELLGVRRTPLRLSPASLPWPGILPRHRPQQPPHKRPRPMTQIRPGNNSPTSSRRSSSRSENSSAHSPSVTTNGTSNNSDCIQTSYPDPEIAETTAIPPIYD